MPDITLLGHSAVRLDGDGGSLVIDPGSFSDLGSLPTADAILVTHTHADHLAAAALAGLTADIWAPEDALEPLVQAGVAADRVHTVAPGQSFTAAGFEVTALGGEHAQVYPGIPVPRNNSYLVDGVILHPGDSVTPMPGSEAVEVLLLPISAPWLKLADAIDFARAHPSARVLPIHDAILSNEGKQLMDRVLTNVLGAEAYRRPDDGEVTTR